MAEFTYNNSYQETIKTTPFYANYRINPEHQLITHMMTQKKKLATGMREFDNILQTKWQRQNYDTKKTTITTESLIQPHIRRYGVITATQHPHHTTIKEIVLKEDRTIQDYSKDRLKYL